ncbi:hypothetical protein ANCDUO_11695 [Ancylostoma duodenale]|uniref:Uncharacterized protein n=1 Tax=Ancylostoma duodenale TaxID=51022 RepID=A0A0C2GAU1_9BILA|nr:hypothetical protein ANCDUO_11695 [Ancylostoma duodenale]
MARLCYGHVRAKSEKQRRCPGSWKPIIAEFIAAEEWSSKRVCDQAEDLESSNAALATEPDTRKRKAGANLVGMSARAMFCMTSSHKAA